MHIPIIFLHHYYMFVLQLKPNYFVKMFCKAIWLSVWFSSFQSLFIYSCYFPSYISYEWMSEAGNDENQKVSFVLQVQ